eukprot:gene17632-23975_t
MIPDRGVETGRYPDDKLHGAADMKMAPVTVLSRRSGGGNAISMRMRGTIGEMAPSPSLSRGRFMRFVYLPSSPRRLRLRLMTQIAVGGRWVAGPA